MSAILCGVGGCVPHSVATTDEWIRTRTGIRQRHIVRDGESTSDLAVRAGRAALKSAGVDSVDLVVLATTTPDHPCPATAPSVARALGLDRVAAFDLNAVCSGFVYGLATVAGFLETGLAERVLLIGADTFSTILDPADRNTASIFGDGAGAVVLRRGNPDEPGALLAFDLGSDGELAELIAIPAGGSKQPLSIGQQVGVEHRFGMQGRAVYRQATRWMTASAKAVLAQLGWQPGDVDLFVGHQANQRILETVGQDLGVPPERVFVNVDRVGNTVAASIPLALAEASAEGALWPGHKVVLTGFGGGITWGSVALTWPQL